MHNTSMAADLLLPDLEAVVLAWPSLPEAVRPASLPPYTLCLPLPTVMSGQVSEKPSLQGSAVDVAYVAGTGSGGSWGHRHVSARRSCALAQTPQPSPREATGADAGPAAPGVGLPTPCHVLGPQPRSADGACGTGWPVWCRRGSGTGDPR